MALVRVGSVGLLLLLVAIGQLLVAENWAPHVLGDELLYSIDARHLPITDARFPNYLFYWLHGLLSSSFTDFYFAQKVLNTVFWWGTCVLVLAYLEARKALSIGAMLLVLGLALSPLAIYGQAFMPETVYTFFVTVGLLLASRVNQRSSGINFPLGLAGAALGVASLAKVHAVFVVVGILVYLGFVKGMSSKTRILGVLSMLSSFLSVKFVAGYAIAGTSALTLFGPTYEGAIRGFIDRVFSTSSAPDLPFMDVKVEAYVEQASVFGGLVLPVIFLAAVYLFLTPAGEVRNVVLRQQGDGAFLGIVSLTTALAVIAFTVLVTTIGDDHSSRLLFRYLEPLLPFALVVFAVSKPGKQKWDTQLAVASGVFTFSWLLSNSFTLPDSTILFSLSLLGPFSALVLGAFAFSKLTITKYRDLTMAALGAALAIPGIVLFGAQSYADQFAEPYKNAAVWVEENLRKEAINSLSVIGASKVTNESTVFMIDQGRIENLVYPRQARIDSDSIPKNIDVVLLLDGTEVSAGDFDQYKGDGFRIAFRVR